MSNAVTIPPIFGVEPTCPVDDIRTAVSAAIATLIHNGHDVSVLFHPIQRQVAAMVEEDDDEMVSVADHLGALLSEWDMHDRSDENYWHAIVDACCELHGFLADGEPNEVEFGCTEAALTAIALAAVTCKGCGACCQYVGAPPGFYPAYLASIGEPAEMHGRPEDAAIWEATPAEAKEIYARTKAEVDRGEYDEDGPCCWLDRETNLCRFYEFRPGVCRECKPSWHCISLRKEYRVRTGRTETAIDESPRPISDVEPSRSDDEIRKSQRDDDNRSRGPLTLRERILRGMKREMEDPLCRPPASSAVATSIATVRTSDSNREIMDG
jgi:Fe-S-cluster containining protein